MARRAIQLVLAEWRPVESRSRIHSNPNPGMKARKAMQWMLAELGSIGICSLYLG